MINNNNYDNKMNKSLFFYTKKHVQQDKVQL